jgi:hypothetical protein
LDPNHEDLTELRLQELVEDSVEGHLFTRRLCDHNEDHVVEAAQMAVAAAGIDDQHQVPDDTTDMTVGEALQNGPSLCQLVLGDDMFLPAVKDGYKLDNMFS